MALQFMDGFDAYSYSQSSPAEDFFTAWGALGANAASSAAGRYAGSSVMATGSSPLARSVVAQTSMTVGVAIKNAGAAFSVGFSDGAARALVYFTISSLGSLTLYIGGSPQYFTYNGNPTFSALSSVNVPMSVWSYLELQVTFGTSGSASVRMNGNQIASLPGVSTAVSGAGSLAVVAIGCDSYSVNFDDLYVLDSTGTINTTFLAPTGGDVRVATFLPTGAGADAQLAPTGAVTNWQCVSEQTPDFDTTYVSSATAAQEDLYAFTPALPTTNQVLGVGVKTLARKDDSNTRSIASLLSSGVTVAQGATNALGSSYIAYDDTYNTDPNTSAAWTVAAVNALQAGVKVIS